MTGETGLHSQALPAAVDQGLEQRLVVRDGLQDVAVAGDVADGPLAQPGAAQSEDVAVEERGREREERGRVISDSEPSSSGSL